MQHKEVKNKEGSDAGAATAVTKTLPSAWPPSGGELFPNIQPKPALAELQPFPQILSLLTKENVNLG